MKSNFILAVLCLCTIYSYAQPVNEPNYNKRKVFNDLPEKSRVKLSDLESLFNLRVGAPVNTIVAGNLRINGKVVSKSDFTDQNVMSVVVRLSDREGATFTFTRRKQADGTFAYLGRIVSRSTADAIELQKENGQYVMIKRVAHDLYAE